MSTEFPSIAAISFKGIPFLYKAVASVRRNKWTVHFLFTPALLATLFVIVSMVALPIINGSTTYAGMVMVSTDGQIKVWSPNPTGIPSHDQLVLTVKLKSGLR